MDKKVVIITGASEGLGKGTAAVFSREGWNVVIAARRQERLEAITNELQGVQGKVLAVPTDVSDPEQVTALVKKTLDTFSKVDVLINNAAIDYPAPIEELTIEQWNKVIGVNLNGVFYTSKAVFAPMKKQKSGYIINISSVAGIPHKLSKTKRCQVLIWRWRIRRRGAFFADALDHP